ncbi:hypothetical protein IV203_037063 [Nitzschia inconspicua]|uniref:Uncharacterized protein n=1 Tax=Nitzschia inconspicua TaxID=303405 RepID=A0A9K3LKR2_9STRA|nr:hypothetical protein IV203_037063 [Nitzschia inconspicua]
MQSFHAAVSEVQGKQCVAYETWSAGEVHQGSFPNTTAHFELSWIRAQIRSCARTGEGGHWRGKEEVRTMFCVEKNVPEASRLHGKEVSSNSSFMCRICMVCLCKKKIGGSTAKSCYEVWHERKDLDLKAGKQRKRLLQAREQEDPDAEKRRKLSANANNQKKSPSKSPGACQLQAEENEIDLQLQEEGKELGEGELEEEDQEEEQEGDKMDEDDIEAEEIEEQYYDDIYFPEDSDSLEESEEDSE